MAKLRKGDQVIIIAGKDKGKQGKILAVKNDRVKVEGVQMVKKHQKPNPMRGLEGGIIEQEAFLHISNVAIFNPTTQKADRIAYQIDADGNKKRIYRSSGEAVATVQ